MIPELIFSFLIKTTNTVSTCRHHFSGEPMEKMGYAKSEIEKSKKYQSWQPAFIHIQVIYGRFGWKCILYHKKHCFFLDNHVQKEHLYIFFYFYRRWAEHREIFWRYFYLFIDESEFFKDFTKSEFELRRKFCGKELTERYLSYQTQTHLTEIVTTDLVTQNLKTEQTATKKLRLRTRTIFSPM